METMLFRINGSGHEKLRDDELVQQFMEKILSQHPELISYQYERDESDYINILVWGNRA